MLKRRNKSHGSFSNSTGLEYHWFYYVNGEYQCISNKTENCNSDIDDLDRIPKKKKDLVSRLVFLILSGIALLTVLFFGVTIWRQFNSLVFAAAGSLIAAAILIANLKNLIFFTKVFYLMYFFHPNAKEIRQWHAADHKLMGLLERDLPITLENLRRMEIFRLSCDTGYFCYSFAYYAAFITSLVLFCLIALFFLNWALLAFLYFFWFHFFFSHTIFYFSQTVFFTAEPTEKQLQEVLASAKRFKEKLSALSQ